MIFQSRPFVWIPSFLTSPRRSPVTHAHVLKWRRTAVLNGNPTLTPGTHRMSSKIKEMTVGLLNYLRNFPQVPGSPQTRWSAKDRDECAHPHTHSCCLSRLFYSQWTLWAYLIKLLLSLVRECIFSKGFSYPLCTPLSLLYLVRKKEEEQRKTQYLLLEASSRQMRTSLVFYDREAKDVIAAVSRW